jgi:hypothetical protein
MHAQKRVLGGSAATPRPAARLPATLWDLCSPQTGRPRDSRLTNPPDDSRCDKGNRADRLARRRALFTAAMRAVTWRRAHASKTAMSPSSTAAVVAHSSQRYSLTLPGRAQMNPVTPARRPRLIRHLGLPPNHAPLLAPGEGTATCAGPRLNAGDRMPALGSCR